MTGCATLSDQTSKAYGETEKVIVNPYIKIPCDRPKTPEVGSQAAWESYVYQQNHALKRCSDKLDDAVTVIETFEELQND